MGDGLYAFRCSVFGHSVDVRALRPLDVPDGGLVSGSRDKTIKVWKPTEASSEFIETHCMMGPTHFIASLCTLPPSTQYPSGLILAGSNDCAIYGFSLEASQPMLKLLGHSNTVSALAAGNFGTVVSGSWDKSARIWLGQKCVMVLEGHQAAVWAVAMFRDLGLTLTGSADKTIRLWRSGHCEKIFRGHEDCIRGLVIVSSLEFLSCSNDSTIRMWQTNGDCVHVFSGHTNYVYGIALISDTGDFVTCSEDRTVKVWRKGSCVQTIQLPAKTLWTIACLKNEDIAVGGSDGSIRIFTKHKELVASPEEVLEFENEVATAHKHTKDMIGDLKLDDVPGMEVLTVPGREDGQTALCRDGETVYVYQWSSAESNWIKIGDVFDTRDNKKELFEGKEYDYIFSIDVEDGKYLKLPYNNGENPWMVAQKFIERHNLSQLFLDQIANFIFSNTEATSVNTTESSEICDPFTGESRYIPHSSSQSSNKTAKPVAATGDIFKGNTYYPMTKYLRFDSSNIAGVEKKLIEFNEKVAPNLKVSPEEIKELLLLADFPTSVTEQQMATLDKVMSWPAECVFPALDLFRLAVRSDTINEKVGEAGSFAVANYLLKHLEPSNLHANKMLALRTFCNFFGHSTGELLLVGHLEKICNAALCCIPSVNKNVQVAVATLYLNYAVALNKSLFSDAQLVSDNALKILELLSEPEAVFRMLVGIGTLMEHPVARACIRSSVVSQHLQELISTEWEEKVQDCAKFILGSLC